MKLMLRIASNRLCDIPPIFKVLELHFKFLISKYSNKETVDVLKHFKNNTLKNG